MANLFNKYIYETYKSIIGIGQSGTSGLTANLEALTDGEGKELPIEVSETEVNITANQTTVKNLYIAGYGEVINEQGYFVGEGGGGGGTGTSGTSGTSGVTGSSGTSGTSGQNGSSGTSGRNGYAGLNGTSGTSGVSTDGTSGTSGVNGSVGVAGTSGTSGINGISGVAINNIAIGNPGQGNLTEQTIQTLQIPANSLADNSVYNIYARAFSNKVVSANTTFRIYIATDPNNLGTAVQITPTTGIVLSATLNGLTIFKQLFVNKANGTQNGTGYSRAGNASDSLAPNSTTTPLTWTAINWTTTQYLVITAQLANASNSVQSYGASIVNGAGGIVAATTSGIYINETTDVITTRTTIPSGTNIVNISTESDGVAIETGSSSIVAMGSNGYCGNDSIFIGRNGAADANSVVVGMSSYMAPFTTSEFNTIVGNNNQILDDSSSCTAIGNSNVINPNIINGIAIGAGNIIEVDGAMAIGQGITASERDTLTTLFMQSVPTVERNFANDTVAAANGVPYGGFYHTNGVLKIRIV